MSTQINISKKITVKDEAVLLTSDVNSINFTGTGITATTVGNDVTVTVPGSGIIVGTTPITSGTVGRVLFEGTGNVVQEDSALFWDNTNKRLGVGATPDVNTVLDVRSAGILATDLAFRVRNSANTANLAKITGDGAFTVGTYTNASARMTVSGSTNINFSSEGGFTAGYFQPNQQAATIWGIQALARQNGANIGKGIYTGADGSSVGSTNYGIHSYAYNGTTNYAGYFDAFGGTNNYALVTQRGFSGFNKTDPSAIVDIKAQGALSSDIALRVRNSADTDNIAEFSGNASVYLGLASNRKISINGANNQIMVGNLTTYTGYQHTLALKSYLRPSMIWEDANAVGARTDLISDSYSNTLLRTSLTTNVLNYANPYGSQAKLINVCGATPNITQNGGFFWYRDNSIEVTLPNRVAWLTPEHQFILYNSPSSNYVSNTDSFQLYSNDIVAGNAAPHFRTENGNIIKLYQQPTGGAASTFVVGVGTAVTDASTFDGYTLGQIVKALRNTGLLA